MNDWLRSGLRRIAVHECDLDLLGVQICNNSLYLFLALRVGDDALLDRVLSEPIKIELDDFGRVEI